MALVEIAFTSAGLTTATTPYTDGDMLGTQLTLANFFASSGGLAYITGARLEDDSAVIGVVDLAFFNASVTPAADNVAAAWSDADALKRVAQVFLPYPAVDSGSAANRTAFWEGAVPLKATTGTSAFMSMITRSSHTFFGATTSLHGILYVEQQ